MLAVTTKSSLEELLYEPHSLSIAKTPVEGMVVGDVDTTQTDHTDWVNVYGLNNSVCFVAKRGEKSTVSRVYICANSTILQQDRLKEANKRAKRKKASEAKENEHEEMASVATDVVVPPPDLNDFSQAPVDPLSTDRIDYCDANIVLKYSTVKKEWVVKSCHLEHSNCVQGKGFLGQRILTVGMKGKRLVGSACTMDG